MESSEIWFVNRSRSASIVAGRESANSKKHPSEKTTCEREAPKRIGAELEFIFSRRRRILPSSGDAAAGIGFRLNGRLPVNRNPPTKTDIKPKTDNAEGIPAETRAP